MDEDDFAQAGCSLDRELVEIFRPGFRRVGGQGFVGEIRHFVFEAGRRVEACSFEASEGRLDVQVMEEICCDHVTHVAQLFDLIEIGRLDRARAVKEHAAVGQSDDRGAGSDLHATRHPERVVDDPQVLVERTQHSDLLDSRVQPGAAESALPRRAQQCAMISSCAASSTAARLSPKVLGFDPVT